MAQLQFVVAASHALPMGVPCDGAATIFWHHEDGATTHSGAIRWRSHKNVFINTNNTGYKVRRSPQIFHNIRLPIHKDKPGIHNMARNSGEGVEE